MDTLSPLPLALEIHRFGHSASIKIPDLDGGDTVRVNPSFRFSSIPAPTSCAVRVVLPSGIMRYPALEALQVALVNGGSLFMTLMLLIVGLWKSCPNTISTTPMTTVAAKNLCLVFIAFLLYS